MFQSQACHTAPLLTPLWLKLSHVSHTWLHRRLGRAVSSLCLEQVGKGLGSS